jgi:hypothetical protein
VSGWHDALEAGGEVAKDGVAGAAVTKGCVTGDNVTAGCGACGTVDRGAVAGTITTVVPAVVDTGPTVAPETAVAGTRKVVGVGAEVEGDVDPQPAVSPTAMMPARI